MSYEIKTVYRAAVPGFESLGSHHQGWYWNRDVAERFTNEGGAKQGHVFVHEVIVMEGGDTLWASPEMEYRDGRHEPTGNTSIEKINVYGDTDEELKEAALERLPDHWKKLLGLPYDEAVAATQKFSWNRASDDQMRNKLLILDITEEEARVLGLGQVRTEAIEGFQAICEKQEEEDKQRKIDHPLIGTTVRMPARSSYGDGDPRFVSPHKFRVDGLAPEAEDGETQYHCTGGTFSSVHPDDKKKIWRRSEIEAANPETEKPS